MNLYPHFPDELELAAALERAIQEHPLLAEAIHTRVTQNRDITDSFTFVIQRGTWESTEDKIASGEEYRDRQRASNPALPKPPTEPKIKIAPKPKLAPPPSQLKTCPNCHKAFTPKRPTRIYCSVACSAQAGKRNLLGYQAAQKQPITCPNCQQTFMPRKPTTKHCSRTCLNESQAKNKPPKPPKPPKAPKLKAPKPPRQPKPAKQPPIVINTVTHNGIQYASTHHIQQLLVHNQPDLLRVAHFRRATMWSLYGARYPILRRLDIGYEHMSDPIPLFSIEDCTRLVDAYRRGPGQIGKLPRYTHPTSTRMRRITIDDTEWMRVNEAISIIAGVHLDEVVRTFSSPYEPNNISRKVAHALKANPTYWHLPVMQLGSVKTYFYRTIDILPLANTFKLPQ